MSDRRQAQQVSGSFSAILLPMAKLENSFVFGPNPLGDARTFIRIHKAASAAAAAATVSKLALAAKWKHELAPDLLLLLLYFKLAN